MKIVPSRIERYFEKFEFKTPYLLCSSDCQSFTIDEVLKMREGAEKEFKELYLGYTETRGHPELRAAIAELYENISENEIIVFAGAEEGVFCSLQAILNSNDHYIVQHPNYQSLEEIPRSMGCEVTPWRMRHTSNWEVDLDFLEQNLRTDTKAIAMINPHNPTGALMAQASFDKVIEMARGNNTVIFSDEVYRLSEYDANDRLPALCDVYENAVSLGVMSKSLGLPGLRIGWIATRNREIFEKIAEIKDYITICNSAPSEYLATIALQNVDIIARRNLDIIESNLNLLDHFFREYSNRLRWVRPKAGPISLVEIIPPVEMENFCMELRDKEGVLLLPGSIFDYDEQHFRMGFGRKNMPEALDRFQHFIDNTL